jgi:hypothetical protein
MVCKIFRTNLPGFHKKPSKFRFNPVIYVVGGIIERIAKAHSPAIPRHRQQHKE